MQLQEEAADSAFHTGEWEQAVAALDGVIELHPQGLDAYANAAWLLWSSGKDDRAMDYYHRMIAANPKDPEGYFIVGQMFFFRRKYPEALPWLQQAEALGLHSPNRHLLGHELAALGRTDDAIAFWQRLLKDDPHDAVARRELDKLQHKTPSTPPTPAPAPPSLPEQQIAEVRKRPLPWSGAAYRG